MSARQLDLFAGSANALDHIAGATVKRPRPVAAELQDDALIAAIPFASLGDFRSLTAEAGRRRLVGAIATLEALCRRFQGFGREHPIAEQTAALEALARIGGREAVRAVRRIIADRIVQGPGLVCALKAAAELGVSLPDRIVVSLLRHDAPEIRAGACGCARPSPATISLLTELLDEADRVVAVEAACALGRIGRSEARPALLRLLREAPSATVIGSITGAADEECLIILGRIARTRPDLAEEALAALDSIGSSRAAKIAAASRRSLSA